MKLQAPSSQHSFPCPLMWTWLNSPSPSKLFISSVAFPPHLPFPNFSSVFSRSGDKRSSSSGPGLAGDARPWCWGDLSCKGGGIPLSLSWCSWGKRQPQTSSPQVVLLIKSPLRCMVEEPTFLLPSQGSGGSLPPRLGGQLGLSSPPTSCSLPSSKMSHFCTLFFSLLAAFQCLMLRGFCHEGQAIQQGGQQRSKLQRIIQNKPQKVLYPQLPLCGRTMIIFFSSSWGNWGLEQGGDLLSVAGIITQAYFLLNTSASHSRTWGPATEHQRVILQSSKLWPCLAFPRAEAACRENKQPAPDLSCWELSCFFALSPRSGD